MKPDHCPLCDSPRIVARRGKRSFVVKDRVVNIPALEYWHCSNCGEVFYPPESGKKIDDFLLTQKKRKAG